MSSKSIHISSYIKALDDGIIPGTFNHDRTIFEFPTVESINSKGACLIWIIRVKLIQPDGSLLPFYKKYLKPEAVKIPEDVIGEITTESYQISKDGVRGKTREGGKPTIIRKGKNIGKVNETNIATQTLRDALSRYNKQTKRAISKDDNKFPPPMLVKPIDSTRDATLTQKDFKKGITVQRKYNGVRAVSFYSADKKCVIMYSRTKQEYLGFTHIKDELMDIFKKDKSSGFYLDGEIYTHGKNLRWISGQARKEEDEKNLGYIIYDCFFPDGPNKNMISQERQKILDSLFKNSEYKYIQRAENFPVSSLDEVEKLRDIFIEEKYEGAIARKNWTTYRYSFNDYHSSNLVKLKIIYDSEFKVVDYTQGKKGKDVGALIWICEVDSKHSVTEDKIFHVVPKDMSYEDRYYIYKCLGEKVEDNITRFERDFKGELLTVEYPERSSKTGKPTQAKSLAFRTFDNPQKTDPMKRLFKEC